MTPKIIFFDVDGTLLSFVAFARSFLERACKRHGLPYSDKLVRTLIETNDALWKKIEKGELTRDELHATRFKIVFDAAGVVCDCPNVIESEFRKEIYDAADLYPGAKETLDYLAKKYMLCIASNAAPDQQQSRLEKAGILGYFSRVFASGEIGADKPSREFWNKVFAVLPDVKPQETVLVGDSPTADMASGACGIKTCWFNCDGKSSEKCPCDYEIHDLRELKNLF